MPDLPSGTVTFLFTDLEGSTRLWEEHADAMARAQARHDAIVSRAIERHAGVVVKTTGDGFHAAFPRARDAVDAAVDAQRLMSDEQWGETGPLRVRIGLHTGEAEYRDGDYYGTALNRAARLMATAHGGQIVVSHATEQLVREALPEGVTLADLGEHQLRDLGQSERVFQIHHPALRAEFPPLRSLGERGGELPVSLTSFVGRERELERLTDALVQSRIVTLIGVGGVGKTRLALQVAADVSPDYAQGAWFCELAPVTDRAALPEAVAACLGVTPQAGESLTTSMLGYLRRKQLLLVLDNCEHVVDSAGSLAEAIAHSCPRVVVLATSREALGIDGELLRPVGSLALPDRDVSVDELATTASVRLFAERAQAVRPDFALTPESAPIVADICRQLDGVPLAIELAAARVASLTVEEIAQRLDQRFRLLTGGRRTALERHQTLRGAVDWSYELLSAPDALVFNRLAVFAGGFALDAAEAVVSSDEVDATDVLDGLSSLVARSMVDIDDSGGATRYRLLETMRQYARERLDATGEADAARRRHAEYYVALAETAQDNSIGRDEARWVRTVEREFANFRSAFDWSVGVGDADLALRLVVALGAFGVPRPRYGVYRWLVNALELPASRHHPLRPHALTWATHSSLVAEYSADIEDIARAMNAAFAEAGLELTVEAHGANAIVAGQKGRLDEAVAHATAAAELALATGDPRAAFYHATVALFLTMAGDADVAVQQAERAVELAAALGSPSQLAPAQNALGRALSTVDPERAIVHLEAASTLAGEIGNEVIAHIAGAWLARLVAAHGDLVRALEIYDALLAGAVAANMHLLARIDTESLAVALASSSHAGVAATIFGALDSPGIFRANHLYDRRPVVAALRTDMGEERFEEFAARGRSMDLDGLVAFARAEVTRLREAVGQRGGQ